MSPFTKHGWWWFAFMGMVHGPYLTYKIAKRASKKRHERLSKW